MQAQVAGLLADVTSALAAFLGKVLPEISKTWWEDAVLKFLSFQQRRRLEQRSTTSIASLDLSALLRVLDQNWYEISSKISMGTEARHFVKEMQTVRNRWAHAKPEGFQNEDVYRDLDTIQRFASVIKADNTIIGRIRECKTALISKLRPVSLPSSEPSVLQGRSKANTGFSLGEIVYIKSNPSVRGAVIAITPGTPECRYTLFVNGDSQSYYASQLQIEESRGGEFQFVSLDQFHSSLSALQIRHPSLSTLYSLNAARVDFIPYQFRPVLKFIRSDRPRLLIADGVGVGKTIEAGLIFRELQARRDVRSVLIICPRPLITERKWQIEMKRFEERFTHLDGSTLRYCINEMDLEGVWPEQHQKAIIPYSLFDETLLYGIRSKTSRKRQKGLLELDPPPRFDLVIVDEAHHIRNTETYTHKGVRFFCDNAEAVLFVTATPIQLGSDELFVLLNVLRPDLIIDRESFEHMAAPNPYINQAIAHLRTMGPDWAAQARASLNEAGLTPWGRAILQKNPIFQGILKILDRDEIRHEERVALITDLEELHTFSGIINRTLRRDIADDFPVRKPETITVEFTPSQKKLHDDLLRVQAEILTTIHGDANINFMMTTIRRQAASCLYGLAPLMQDILMRRIDELTWDEVDNSQEAPDQSVIKRIEKQIQDVLEQASRLDPHDPKLEAFLKILNEKQALINNKVMLFSSFRHTLNYLNKSLLSKGCRVGLIHGDTSDDDRVVLRNRFQLEREQDDALDVLLFSEVGCEGLDYQFCDCIVNYDLPWNPMRIEQRIGRIDRKGQKSDIVLIYNLITPGTVDADIYEKCLLRIGVFNSAIGASEEILGSITREIRDIAENLNLTEEERRQKLQQLSDNKIRLVQEQEELEARQVELFGIRLPAERIQKEISQASSFWLSSDAIRNLVVRYLERVCGKDQEFILGEKTLKTLRLSQEMRNRLLQDYSQVPRQASPTHREWENWLKGGNPHLTITFDAETASQHPEAAFIIPIHPLARQAARGFDSRHRVATALEVYDSELTPGEYPFAIYQWHFHGIREDLLLYPIMQDQTLTDHLIDILKTGHMSAHDTSDCLGSNVIAALDSEHYRHWVIAREKHQRRTQELALYRRESLTTSHRARMSLLNEQLSQASDEKIQRMRKSQIASAEADYARRIQELDIAMERTDITAQPVAVGVVRVNRERPDAK